MKNFLTFLFVIFFFFSCSKEETGNSSIYMEDGYAQIVDEEVTRYFEKTESDHLVLSAATPASYIPAVGDIICCRITEKTPDGFLGKVSRVDRGTDGISVYTETVPLDEAFENLEGDNRFDLDAGVESIVNSKGEPVGFEYMDDNIWSQLDTLSTESARKLGLGTRIAASKTIGFSYDYQAGDLSFKGNIFLSASADFDIRISHGKIEYVNIEVTPRVGITADFTAKKPGSVKHEIGTYRVKLGIYTIGGIIVVKPVLKFSLIVGISGNVELKSTVGYEFMHTTYFTQYSQGKWRNGYVDKTGKSKGFVASKLELNGEAYIEAKAGLLLGVFSEKLIGAGLNSVGKNSLSGAFTFDFQNILLTGPKVKAVRTLSGEFYCYAKIFSNQFSRETATKEIELSSREYELFPVSENLTATLSDSEIDAHIG